MMLGRLILRLIQPLVWLWLLLSVVFILSRLGPDHLSEQLLPAESAVGGSRAARQKALLMLRHRLGQDQPLWYWTVQQHAHYGAWWPTLQWQGSRNQYHHWLSGLLRGQAGHSQRDGRPVSAVLGEALPLTLLLTVPAALLSVALALLLATRLGRPRWWQPGVVALGVGLDALPLFLVATTLLLVFANPDALAWFPAYGLPPELLAGSAISWPALLWHLALPIASLVLVTTPGLMLQLAAALQREQARPYVATARAKGLSLPQVLWRHQLRNAALPFLTLLTDLLPALLAGALVVEVIFALPGMGRRLAEAAATHDLPVLLAGVVLVALARLFSYWLADVLYAWADPRLRHPPVEAGHA